MDGMSWEWRTGIGLLALCFNAFCIVWLLVYGHSENLLHQNALSWSYICSMSVMAGFGFGAILPLLDKLKKSE